MQIVHLRQQAKQALAHGDMDLAIRCWHQLTESAPRPKIVWNSHVCSSSYIDSRSRFLF